MEDSEEEDTDTSITPCNLLPLSSLLFILLLGHSDVKVCCFVSILFFYTVSEGTSSATPITIEGSAYDADSPAIP